MKREEKTLIPGTVIQHFKREGLSEEQKKSNMYKYMVVSVAQHTETGEELVIYSALYDNKTYARPKDMFLSKVDKEKYPNTKQEYRFEIVE